jgi:molybdenum cofactor guanylyltransferase
VVLAGGDSRRMGMPKPWLPFGPELMLQRVVRLVGEAVRPVVVAARAGQELPELPPWSRVVYDRAEHQGPMEGLATALEQLQGRTELAFVAGCDAPLLAPRLVHRMIALADAFDVAVPHVDGLDHPLTAVYRTQLATKVRESLDLGSRRLASLLDDVRTRRVTADELIDVDPCLLSLVNINTPDEYRTALKQAGFANVQTRNGPVKRIGSSTALAAERHRADDISRDVSRRAVTSAGACRGIC